MELKRIKKPANREEWLMVAAELLKPYFSKHAEATIPTNLRISTGWSKGARKNSIAWCWASKTAKDKSSNIFISPEIADSISVLQALAHELCHAADDCKSQHSGQFGRFARAVGLEGKLTATYAGPTLKLVLQTIVDRIGPYPHSPISYVKGGRTQTTRMLKLICEKDNYTVRTTRMWLDLMGPPTCPCGKTMFEEVK